MVPHHNREDHRLPARTLQISTQRPRLAQRPRLRKHMVLQRSLSKPLRQRPILPAHRQTLLPIRKPRLRRRILQQPRRSPRRHQIMPTQPRPIKENKIVLINPGMLQETPAPSALPLASIHHRRKPSSPDDAATTPRADFGSLCSSRSHLQVMMASCATPKFFQDYPAGSPDTIRPYCRQSPLPLPAPASSSPPEIPPHRSKSDASPAPSPSPQSPAPPAFPSAPPPHTPPDHESRPPPHPAAHPPQSTHTLAAPSTPAPAPSARGSHSSSPRSVTDTSSV